ncbi:Protease IV [hydrothermal vent metagenome]|uniref:Protease IV n=1 Tax=hydrothermal vent metagenome TaxID=652676 RepID=A0A3B0SAW7_9ZZZZ
MFEADTITAERKNRRALSFWRIIAILALMIAFVALLVNNTQTSTRLAQYSEHIARIHIDGLITGNQKTIALLGKIEKSASVKAVIVRIDSPGGTTVGSEAIYEAIRKIAKNKPVVAVMDSVAASGGYITALASDHIVARGNTVTGSIGVIFQWPEVHGLLGKIGVEMKTIKSGPQKAEPNIYAPLKDDVRPVLEAMVSDSFDWFVGLVSDRRKMSKQTVYSLADGRVYSGRQALKQNLIDEIGGEEVAVKWLVKEKKISQKLKITTWATPTTGEKVGISLSVFSDFFSAVGLNGVAQALEDTFGRRQQRLDGLLAVWQPAIR